ncbi:ATP-binding cassette domain-containing protein [Clostridium thailandense]|uniref:ATP-binding cassette domain-containing protein n=1 Tax=Clostridium thailandense TaxID=2794346 RepID=UPI001FEB7B69|nr:ATP-binding cassette domain-containing protein [Clostridium thailandense]
MKAINIEKLKKSYDGQTNALNNIDLSISKGEIFGFLGPNGSGKTTTVRILNGILSKTSGYAEILGIPVGEKEHKTMESLLYTPISMEQLLRAKILGVFVPSYIITLVSFIAFGIIFNIGGFIYFGGLIFPDIKWLITIFWICPVINLLSLVFTVMVSAKSETFQEAQQVSGLLVIPVILILVGQMTGVLLISKVMMFIGGGVLLILDYVLIKRISSKFIPEKLI